MAGANVATGPAPAGRARVIGGSGTGKTSLLVATAAGHIAAGAHPESVLLLCGAARGVGRTRTAVSAALRESGGCRVIREPLVRSVHSYAFAVLRLAAERAGGPPPRLVTGAEQDAVIRDLLVGDLADGPNAAVKWPESLRPALATAGFANQLADLLSRCAERGVDGLRLQKIGRRARRPDWVAAGQFAQQYEQVMLLRAATGTAAPQAAVPALGAAELVGAALEAFAVDPNLLQAERDRVRVLLVDDAQHLDQQSGQLVAALCRTAEVAIIAGDPNQTVFGFRGAGPGLLVDDEVFGNEEPWRAVELTRSHRCAPAVARAVSGIAARLPGVTAGRAIEGCPAEPGSVTTRVAASSRAEAAVIADALRRAHLVDGVPWRQMAVIVRSARRSAPALSRALAAAGVRVVCAPPAVAVADQPAVRTLLIALAAATSSLAGDSAVALLTGPVGRVDPVSLRRLRRRLRRSETGVDAGESDQLLVEALTGEVGPANLTAVDEGPIRRVRRVLAAATSAVDQDPRYALWQVWCRSGLQRRWLAASDRGGSAGAQADRDLDAVATLFDIAEDYVSRTPGATVRGLVDHVSGLQLAPPDSDPAVAPDAVAVLSVHQAVGREWDFVVLAGMQEGLWPNVSPRDGLLGAQRLVDVLDGVGDSASRRAPVLADERRLLVAALGRARHRVLVTAVEADSGGHGSEAAAMPSSFFAELAALAGERGADTTPVSAPPVLAPSALVGRLRAVVCAPLGEVDENRRQCAATQLARLAAAGVAGADPAKWYGMLPVSSTAPLADVEDRPIVVSPSAVQTVVDCPLRWLLERHGGADRPELSSAIGSLMHGLVAAGLTAQQALQELDKAWELLPFESSWFAENELRRHRSMLEDFADWRAETRGDLTEVGVEMDVDGVLGRPEPGSPEVRVTGRIDRLERDAEGRLVVIDVKTGKTPVSKDDAQRHAQLALYQLAIAAGLLPDGDKPGGGRLVYIGRGAAERDQDPLTPQSQEEWEATVHRAAAATVGPVFVARLNDSCRHCPVRSSCPAQRSRQ